jgi:hypothetical protein
MKCQLIFNILHVIISQTAKLYVVSVFLNNFAIAHVQLPKRWGAWIEAVNNYSEHFKTVKSIAAKFPSESAVSERESPSAVSDTKVACSTAYI